MSSKAINGGKDFELEKRIEKLETTSDLVLAAQREDNNLEKRIDKLENTTGVVKVDGLDKLMDLRERIERLEKEVKDISDLADEFSNDILSTKSKLDKIEKLVDMASSIQMNAGTGLVKQCNDAMVTIVKDFTERLEKVENKLYDGPVGFGRGMAEREVVERIKKLERPQMERLDEQRKNIIDLALQLQELGNHDIELRERIEKLENEFYQGDKIKDIEQDTVEKAVKGLVERLEKLEENKDRLENHLLDKRYNERIEKLENDMKKLQNAYSIAVLGRIEKLEKLDEVNRKHHEEYHLMAEKLENLETQPPPPNPAAEMMKKMLNEKMLDMATGRIQRPPTLEEMGDKLDQIISRVDEMKRLIDELNTQLDKDKK